MSEIKKRLLGATATKIYKTAPINFPMSVCPSACNDSRIAERIFIKFH